jgi:hypothetical protein
VPPIFRNGFPRDLFALMGRAMTTALACSTGPTTQMRSAVGVPLFLIAQQLSFGVPYLQAMAVDYVMIGPQGFGGLESHFERLKRLRGMAAVSRDAKRSVQAMIPFRVSDKFV